MHATIANGRLQVTRSDFGGIIASQQACALRGTNLIEDQK
jgi:hypothetical protein